MDDRPFTVPVLRPGQRVSLTVLLLVWVAAVAAFWAWWFRGAHVVTPFGMAVNSGLLIWTMALPAWFFAFAWRMRRPDPALPVPGVRTAMIVTKAPSEPWDVVRRTLEGMLDQDFPWPYDVWLADERPDDPVVLDWCRRHGVRISSRFGVPEYHRATWPRRTKCKEGNLAYFYDHWGYDDYDVVAQLDADHVPTRGYLAAMVRPFVNPRVGYVAAPSICDANAGRSWSARGRLYKEATFHGPQQAGSSDGFAPACIGSHYAVRTEALRDAGGLGPELAEDFSTTLILSAHGWEGAFALDAIAHGDGPETFADCIVQEYQWSKSLTLVLLRHNNRYWKRLDLRRKLKLGFNQVWYPLYAAHMLLASTFPLWALATATPWTDVRLLDFVLHVLPVSLAGSVTLGWARRQGVLRPHDAPVLSWEAFLFMFARWPWVLWGVVQAVAEVVRRRAAGFIVTPKGGAGARPLPAWSLTPYAAISLGSSGAAVAISQAGGAQGYHYFALVNGLLYALVCAGVVVLHGRENPWLHGRRLWRPAGLTFACLVAALVAWVERGYVALSVMLSPEEADMVHDIIHSRALADAWAAPVAAGVALCLWALRDRLAADLRMVGVARLARVAGVTALAGLVISVAVGAGI